MVSEIIDLVNNAGIGTYHSSLALSQKEIEDYFALNVFSAIYMTQNVIPKIKEGGRIINVSSIVSKTGMGAMPIYSSTKAALDSLTYVWAQEVR
jgi:short-subunit dehydrogenase